MIALDDCADVWTVPARHVQRVVTKHELQMVWEGPEDSGRASPRVDVRRAQEWTDSGLRLVRALEPQIFAAFLLFASTKKSQEMALQWTLDLLGSFEPEALVGNIG